MIKAYFGSWDHKPPDISELPDDLRRTLPSRMRDRVYDITESFWTNNPYWLSGFPPRKIVLCLPEGRIPLIEHPDWPYAKERFSAAEFANSLFFNRHRELF